MTVSIYEAKTHLSRLIAELEGTDDEIVITRHDVPVARLVPYRNEDGDRRLGGWEGDVVIADDFDELPDDVAAAFAGHED